MTARRVGGCASWCGPYLSVDAFSFRGYWVSMLHVAQEDIMIVGNQ